MSDFAPLDTPDLNRPKQAQLTVTIAPELAKHVERLAGEYGTTKSAVVGRILAFDKTNRDEALMAEGYKEMGGEWPK